ncbi:MAG: S-layer homology domain-containing protein [Clostridiales bacterium]|nr:S-layer homology domain-containing protein [Clostridiales bacterium]
MKTKSFCKHLIILGVMLLFIFQSISLAEEHTFDLLPTETTSTKHVLACIECGYEISENHDFDYAKTSDTHHEYACTVCGYTKTTEKHDFKWVYASSNVHEYTCNDCGYVQKSGSHTYEYLIDNAAGTHYLACTVCGHEKGTAQKHTYEMLITQDGTQHYESCSVCGVTRNQESHELKWKYTTTTHYKECECGYKTTAVNHDFNYTAKDATTHTKSCECGYKTTENHTFSGNTCTKCEYEKACSHTYGGWLCDSTNHWKECSICGVDAQITAHTYKYLIDNAAGTHYLACTVCGYEKGTAEKHTYEMLITQDGTQHYESCSVCGATRNQESHDLKWKYTTTTHYKECECGYKTTAVEHNFKYTKNDSSTHYKECECGYKTTESHTYNVNTCTKCGYEKACSHTSGAWQKDNTNHWKTCTICGVYTVNKTAHTFSGNKCTVCGYERDCTHTSGAWQKDSTNHWKTCTICGVYTVNKTAHTYSNGKCTVCEYACGHNLGDWQKDSTNHWKVCSVCSLKVNTAKHTFSGNKCTVCGYEKDCTHISGAWQKDSTNHWKTCTICGVYTVNKTAHTYSNGKCTVCEYACGHNLGDWQKDSTNHWKVCSVCSLKVNTAKHTFSGNKCTVCGYEKGCTHTPSSWKHDGTNHWKVCTECGAYTTAKEAHKFDGNKCTVCGYEKPCTHTSGDWKYNSTNHWKLCTICGDYTVNKTAHTFKNDKCTVCGYERDSKDNDTDISVSPKSGSYVSYGDRIKITAEDDDGIDYVEYYWDDDDDDSSKKYSDEFTVKVPSEEGKHYLYVRAEDEKGDRTSYERFIYYVEEDYYPGNSDNLGELNDAIRELRVEIGNVDDRIVYEPGEEIEYYINYYNGTSSKISNVKIVVEIPNSNFKIVDVENDGTKTTKKATWNLGTLKSKEAGRVYFTMEYNASKKLDNDLIFNVEAKIYKSSKEQDSSYTRNMIYNEKAKTEGTHLAYCSGYPDGRFKADGTITRAEMATMIARVVGLNVDNYKYKNAFSDVSPEHWAAGAIQACIDNGLVTGYSYGRFEPELPATRAMLAYSIAKVLEVEDIEPIYIKATDTKGNPAMIVMEQMLRFNIIDGYSNGTVKPDKYITRAEAVVIINKYLFRGELLTGNSGYYGNQLKQFTDLYYGHWAYNQIMEATCDHDYVRTYDGNELLAD